MTIPDALARLRFSYNDDQIKNGRTYIVKSGCSLAFKSCYVILLRYAERNIPILYESNWEYDLKRQQFNLHRLIKSSGHVSSSSKSYVKQNIPDVTDDDSTTELSHLSELVEFSRSKSESTVCYSNIYEYLDQAFRENMSFLSDSAGKEDK